MSSFVVWFVSFVGCFDFLINMFYYVGNASGVCFLKPLKDTIWVWSIGHAFVVLARGARHGARGSGDSFRVFLRNTDFHGGIH